MVTLTAFSITDSTTAVNASTVVTDDTAIIGYRGATFATCDTAVTLHSLVTLTVRQSQTLLLALLHQLCYVKFLFCIVACH